MLTIMKMQEILALKLRGYSVNEIYDYYTEKGHKAPSQPTIRKYYGMDLIPKNPNQNLLKDKVFDHEPYRSTIIELLKNNPGCYLSSIYDVLEERYVETGISKSLPGNEQTLRHYVHYLKDHELIDLEPVHKRVYDHVFDTPPGEQMLLDFGQVHLKARSDIYFICLLLRYSRIICVYAQDHKYNAEEACLAIYRAFCKLGGRPAQLVIDQDAVFVSSETYGEVITTRVFNDFCQEQGLKLWVCNKSDPESKGPIENVVGFVKKNFFSARKISCIEDVWRSLPGWLERKNQRIHQTTLRVPLEVFKGTEKAALKPVVPSVYENTPCSFTETTVSSLGLIQYKASKYSVPHSYCFKKVFFKAVGPKLHIYDEEYRHICTHTLSACRGSVNQLPEHRKEATHDWQQVMESLRAKWNCCSFQTFINGFKKENSRHLYSQLAAVERFLDAEKPERSLAAQVLDVCCQKDKYCFSQFKVTYSLVKAGYKAAPLAAFNEVQLQSLDVYKKAFQARVSH